MSNRQKSKKISPRKIGIFIAFVAVIILLFYLATFLKQEEILPSNVADTEKSQENSEIAKIREANKEAIVQAQKQGIMQVRPIEIGDHVWGELEASVQLIIYNDLTCPFCANFYATAKTIKEFFSDRVVIAFRHFPLPTHPMALEAALASECAAEQDNFFKMLDKLFTDNQVGKMSIEQFKQDAAALGLNIAEFDQCLETEKYKEKIQAQISEAKKFNITGTPGNFVNGEPVPGAYPYEDFIGSDGQERKGMKSIIERHLDEGLGN